MVEGIAKGPPESLSERPCGGALKSSLCRVPRKVSVKGSVEGLCAQSCGESLRWVLKRFLEDPLKGPEGIL